jgi:cytidylate kinase
MVSGIEVSNYLSQAGLCLLSCVIIAFGVFLEVKAKVTYLAGEGLALAFAKTFKKDFGKVKVGVDSSLVITGIISSFVLLGNLQGIREGTIVAALLVGTIVRFFNRKITFVDSFLQNKTEIEKASVVTIEPSSSPKVAITIAREFGSGGHEIGEIVAQKLGYSFYDTNLIDLSATEAGLTKEYVKEHEQKLANSLLFDLYEQNFAYINEQMPPLDTLFMVQSKVIRDISEKESCVIVGRCADFVLKGHKHCLNVFIHASNEFRIQRVIKEYGIEPASAEKELERKDRDRKNYCKHYTQKIWGESTNYNLTIDSSLFGIEESANLIVNAIQQFANK